MTNMNCIIQHIIKKEKEFMYLNENLKINREFIPL